MFINRRLLASGFGIWLFATIGLRMVGQNLLKPGDATKTTVLFAVSFPIMALLVRGLCHRVRLKPEQWVSGAASIALPTLVFDPFSTLFFAWVFPNIDAAAAPLFGAWILWCCAGAFLGAMVRPGR
jgi:hypothetical protein